jgi:hypothetical protein
MSKVFEGFNNDLTQKGRHIHESDLNKALEDIKNNLPKNFDNISMSNFISMLNAQRPEAITVDSFTGAEADINFTNTYYTLPYSVIDNYNRWQNNNNTPEEQVAFGRYFTIVEVNNILTRYNDYMGMAVRMFTAVSDTSITNNGTSTTPINAIMASFQGDKWFINGFANVKVLSPMIANTPGGGIVFDFGEMGEPIEIFKNNVVGIGYVGINILQKNNTFVIYPHTTVQFAIDLVGQWIDLYSREADNNVHVNHMLDTYASDESYDTWSVINPNNGTKLGDCVVKFSPMGIKIMIDTNLTSGNMLVGRTVLI